MGMHKRAAAVLIGFAIGGVLAVSAGPASANEAAGVVHGTGPMIDDWQDEGVVSASSHSYSNLAGMWQAILWADKSLRTDGDPWEIADIDCRFGPETTYSTKRWQKRWDGAIAVDGVVGKDTFTTAGNGGLSVDDNSGSATYNGLTASGVPTLRTIGFVRNSEGQWAMYLNGDLRKIWYNSATFNQC